MDGSETVLSIRVRVKRGSKIPLLDPDNPGFVPMMLEREEYFRMASVRRIAGLPWIVVSGRDGDSGGGLPALRWKYFHDEDRVDIEILIANDWRDAEKEWGRINAAA